MSGTQGVDYKKMTLRKLMWKSTLSIGAVIAAGLSVVHTPKLVTKGVDALKVTVQEPFTKAFLYALSAALGVGALVGYEVNHLTHVVPTLTTEEFWLGVAGISVTAATILGPTALVVAGLKALLTDGVIAVLIFSGTMGLTVAWERVNAWFEEWQAKKLAEQATFIPKAA